MKSIEERIKDLPRIVVDVKNQFVIELVDNGIPLGKVIGNVNEMQIGVDKNSVSIDLCLLNYDKQREVTRFEFKNPDFDPIAIIKG